jgi:hypothetical protein
MEVSGDQAVAALHPDVTGKGADDLPVVPALEPGLITGTAGALQPGPDPQHDRWRNVVGSDRCQSAVQEQAQQAVATVTGVDLVAMAEKEPPPLQVDNGRTAVHLCPELLAEDWSHVKIVVAFEVHQTASTAHQGLKRCQHVIELPERIRGETKPEIEQVAHNEERFRVPLQLAKELQQQAVIPVSRSNQMGIGKKNRTHAGIVLSLPADVNREERYAVMGIVHNVEIAWNELMDAFTSGTGDRVYFLDRFTGEIFFVPAVLEDDDFWRQVETNRERFLEIPRFEYSNERQIMSGFIDSVTDTDLKKLLGCALGGRKPYGNINDILDFFPDEQEKLLEMKDEFVTSRVKCWLEEHNLFTVEMDALFSPRI